MKNCINGMNKLEPDVLESSFLSDCAGLTGVDGEGLGKFERGEHSFLQGFSVHHMPGEADGWFPFELVHQEFFISERA